MICFLFQKASYLEKVIKKNLMYISSWRIGIIYLLERTICFIIFSVETKQITILQQQKKCSYIIIHLFTDSIICILFILNVNFVNIVIQFVIKHEKFFFSNV
jgi:hypothetical protein